MKKLYLTKLALASTLLFLLTNIIVAQNCATLTAVCKTYESRCTATGSVKIKPTGGSGSYQYKATGPVNTNFTTTDSITGLSAGIYTIAVNDIVTNCTFTLLNVVVAGTYADPRFTLNSVDVSCDNGNNGSINVLTRDFGRAPFLYSIVAPSTANIGTVSTNGQFNNLRAGSYSIRLSDSCGGIQTRLVIINNYTWWIDSYSFTKFSCDSARGFIKVLDSKGNNNLVAPIAGMQYGIVRQAGDTVWSTNPSITFFTGTKTIFTVVVKDKCGNIKKGNITLNYTPSVSGTVNIVSLGCNNFTASVSNVVNFFNPTFCLFNASNVQVSCNTTGTFSNITFGNYCIKAKDACTDTTILRCFTVSPPPIFVGNNIGISNKKCTTFTASVVNSSGLTSALYCLLDSVGVQVTCNGTGIFNNLPYQHYCLQITDGCVDTTITRCFNPIKPKPSLPPLITPAYTTCVKFGVAVVGDSLSNPRFCLKDSVGNTLLCNNTGVFDSLAFGRYCVHVYDSCYDTTIVRCFSVTSPKAYNDLLVNVSNKTCTNFTASISTSSLVNANYCLYTSTNVLVGCNNTGVFNSIANGSYCIKTRASCPDSTYTNCFTVKAPIPNIGNTVNISNRSCTKFTATVVGFQNLTNPLFCLLSPTNVQIACNTTGVFNNINYGSYCISMKDGCYDTTIKRCFRAVATPVKIIASAKKSCSYGKTAFDISISGGTLPTNIKVYNAQGVLISNQIYNGGTITIDNLIGNAGQIFKIYATDNCGAIDSLRLALTPSVFSKVANVMPKCPSATWQTGSGSIITTATSNTGTLTIRIIKKDNVTYATPLAPSTVVGAVNTFNNLGAGKYIIRYRVNDNCNVTQYDTVTILPYNFPNLNKSNAYQCDVNGFSVGAVVLNGVAPFNYEIIGSTPAAPSIVRPPQSNPIFNINNGTNYSLIRLRVVDACGNASLADASILPLSNSGITATYNCFQLGTTLKVDSIYNSTYVWYKKNSLNAIDSTIIASSTSYSIPSVLPTDTGWYFCKVVVNSGCIKRTFRYNLNGSCSNFLPITLNNFTGKYIGENIGLQWQASLVPGVLAFEVERKGAGGMEVFEKIGMVSYNQNDIASQNFNFVDQHILSGINYYRLKIVYQNGTIQYSNTINFLKNRVENSYSIYPNPATESLFIEFKLNKVNNYVITLSNMKGQVLQQINHSTALSPIATLNRKKWLSAGIYVLTILNSNSKEVVTQKVIFK